MNPSTKLTKAQKRYPVGVTIRNRHNGTTATVRRLRVVETKPGFVPMAHGSSIRPANRKRKTIMVDTCNGATHSVAMLDRHFEVVGVTQ